MYLLLVSKNTLNFDTIISIYLNIEDKIFHSSFLQYHHTFSSVRINTVLFSLFSMTGILNVSIKKKNKNETGPLTSNQI